MSKKWIVAAALLAALALPVMARAHGGHTHKVLGTVLSVEGDHVTIKGTDGKTVVVMLSAKTTVTRGKARLDATAIKVGERLSVDAMQDKTMLMAQTVKLAVAQARK
jgi:hypothetical protein